MKPLTPGLIVTFFLLLSSCGGKTETISPSRENIVESVYASGWVKSRDQYDVFAPANGLISRILVAEGDSVKKGQVILELVNETARLNLEKAGLAREYSSVDLNRDKLLELRTTINQLQDKLRNDSLLLERQQRLWEQQIGTRVELEQRELAYSSTQESLRAARLRYSELERQIRFAAEQAAKDVQISRSLENDYTVRSKINGRIYKILKEPGEMITIQNPVAVIGGYDDFYLDLQVDEYDIGLINIGSRMLITMDSYRNQVYDAVVTKIIPYMDERSRAFTVEAEFISKLPALYPNLSVEANIITRVRENTLTIPAEYLVKDSFVLQNEHDTIAVKIGLRDHRKVEILSGISEQSVLYKPSR